MGHESTPEFRTFHALRIKGFATVEVVAEMTAMEGGHVEEHLRELGSSGHAQFRETRSLWQVTADGRTVHLEHLERDLHGAPLDELADLYEHFFSANSEFKELCTRWQLRDGEPNDHSDEKYDAAVVDELGALHADALPVVTQMGEMMRRLGPYSSRLVVAHDRVREGDASGFTGVMCNSYHDIWMELHEDLILTQRIDRGAEGSF